MSHLRSKRGNADKMEHFRVFYILSYFDSWFFTLHTPAAAFMDGRQYSGAADQAAESARKTEFEESHSNADGSDYYYDRSEQSEDSVVEQKTDFFSGCDNFKSLRKQYLRYCKELHPDNAEGNEDLFKYMKSQYESLSKKSVA